MLVLGTAKSVERGSFGAAGDQFPVRDLPRGPKCLIEWPFVVFYFLIHT